ncbi:Zn-ribbon domain-containing OB-fold protein [Devosia sp. CN2-171]|uniref:Zn-ribbon domain-containing OB-fold protein n=1 Tax=Devosia sp. CN2-171 TaxID=3400909 RepID=UPI003BF8A77A
MGDSADGTGFHSQVFWDATAQGRLVLPQCVSCGRYHWYPRAACPFCSSTEIEWVSSSGTGRIYAHTLFRRTETVIAYVELDEGPRMLTHILTDDPKALRIGDMVEVAFIPRGDEPECQVPVFRPAGTTLR